MFFQGGSHRVSMSSEEKDPFRFRHMISTDALQVRALTNSGTVHRHAQVLIDCIYQEFTVILCLLDFR